MHSLPFRLLVVSELDLQDPVRSGRPSWHPPGAVEEFQYQALWTSKPNTSFPQELGLILLSAQPATIKSLRLTVNHARAPSQIFISASLPTRQRIAPTSNPLDAISRYLSAEWKPCCKPLIWEECSTARPDTSRESDSRSVRLDLSDCSYVKLVVHEPKKCDRNEHQQVVLEEIELLASTEDFTLGHPGLRAVDDDNARSNHRFDRLHQPIIPSFTNDSDELQAVLLDAGVPMDLVAEVATMCDGDVAFSPQLEDTLLPSDASNVAPESGTQDSEPDTLKTRDSEAEEESMTPFDKALRQYVEQAAQESALLEEILATNMCKPTDDVTSWQSPTISPTDPVNSNEITLYTFGTFFTQCLLCGGSDVQVTCVQMAERAACLLKDVVGATSAFEGLVALVVLSIREAKSSQIFQAAMHLAYTVFMTEATGAKKALQPELAEHCRIGVDASTTASTLGLVEEVAQANWTYGLRMILEWTLASPFCWSISHSGKPVSAIATITGQSTKVPPSIDRDFLQLIRLLVDQELTSASFFVEILDLRPSATTAGITFARNRLRLLRLVLRNEIIRYQFPTNLKASVQNLCSSFLSPVNSGNEHGSKDHVAIRLASECVGEISRSSHGTQESKKHPKGLLTFVRKHLEMSNHPNSHHCYRYEHKGMFVQDPFSDAERVNFTTQLKHYFSLQPRPKALYRHSFERGNSLTRDDSGAESRELFRKGNIGFHGQIVSRTPPKETFHDEIRRKTAPFVFGIGTSSDTKSPSSSQVAAPQEIVSSFAAFRGTIEQRSDPPKRSSKVSPEVQQHNQSIAKGTTTTPNKPSIAPVVSTTASNIPNDIVPVKPSEANSSKAAPDLATTTPLPSNPSAAMPPIQPSSPFAAGQTSQKPDDVKQLETADKSDRRTSVAKNTGKAKVKPKGKSDGKEPDNCVLQ